MTERALWGLGDDKPAIEHAAGQGAELRPERRDVGGLEHRADRQMRHLEEHVRDLLVSYGLQEFVTYSLSSPGREEIGRASCRERVCLAV